MVEATPTGLGRNPEAVARIAARVGIHVVHVTGVHRSAHYPAGHWLHECDEAEMARRFIEDVTAGLPAVDGEDRGRIAAAPNGLTVQAGAIKLGIDYWRIDGFARRAIAAVGSSHRETRAPVMVHLEYCSAGHEVLDELELVGVSTDRIALAHVDRNPDPILHSELAARGAYLGYDGMARHREHPDSTVVDCIARVLDSHPGRVLLGGDVARRSRYASYGGMPGLAYLPRRFLPVLRARIGEGLVESLLCDNVQRWLSISG